MNKINLIFFLPNLHVASRADVLSNLLTRNFTKSTDKLIFQQNLQGKREKKHSKSYFVA